MSESGRVIAFESSPRRLAFPEVRRRLTELLIEHTLIDSYDDFRQANRAYPFVQPAALMPGARARSTERPNQRTALVFAVDGKLPVSLNKHFRLRALNRVTWRNIQRLAPELDLSDYRADDRRFDSPAVDTLLTKLLPLDYALLIEETAVEKEDMGVFALSHLHVKVERLTDNAIKDLGRKLGYIDRRLFERGEDYVEALENKFYEYHGFASNASGRKSAAAMATQLLTATGLGFVVCVASQEDNRLTVLDDSDLITQYLLIRPDAATMGAFRAALNAAGVGDSAAYVVADEAAGGPVLILRARFGRTEAALETTRAERDQDVMAPWLALVDESIVARPGLSAPDLAITWGGRDSIGATRPSP
ncbi:MAG: hypothetical protein QF893_21405 [Alphaproteobacteria bacterium]|jgi:hypothetical protein|nr:hypothetical protein [Alphaproteobacteria bacterium]